MSDDEYYEEETTSRTSAKGDEAFARAKSGLKKSELDEQLKEYINEWRKTREKEEEELKRLKEKQAKRKEIRMEQEKKIAQQKKEEEDKFRKEENDKKSQEAEEKKKRLEEAEAKRQQMLEAQKAKAKEGGSNKKTGEAAGHLSDARREMSKTKEQLEEEKEIALSIRIKPMDLESMDSDELRTKVEELFNITVQLETDKYDFEQRTVTQDYELMELKERQKVQLRQKAMKKGLDPEALIGKHPPKIRMYSKYERRTDTRTYEDRKTLYEGGWEVLRAETMDSFWKEKYEEWTKRTKSRLPKWFGERPGKRAGDPETPEGEESKYAADAEDEEEVEEEEEEEYSEEEEEEEEEDY